MRRGASRLDAASGETPSSTNGAENTDHSLATTIVAVEEERRADADGDPVDRGDDRLVDGRERLHEADGAFPEVRLGSAKRRSSSMSWPAVKHAGHAGDQDGADAGIALADRERVGGGLVHVRR